MRDERGERREERGEMKEERGEMKEERGKMKDESGKRDDVGRILSRKKKKRGPKTSFRKKQSV